MAIKSNINEKDVPVPFDDAIDSIGTGYIQYKLIFVGGCVLFASYIANGSITFILQAAQCDLGMDSLMKGRLAAANVLGLILGCHLMGFLSDTQGRRYILVRCLFLDFTICLLTSVAPNNYYLILLMRTINGFVSCGSHVSIYAYIGEFQSNRFRSNAILAMSILATIFYMYVPGIAWVIIPQHISINLYPGLVYKSWRLYYTALCIPSLLALILVYLQPESPKFLLAKGKHDEAVEVLRRMFIQNKGKDKEFKVRSLEINNAEKVATLGDDSNKAVAFLRLMWNQTAPLFKSPHRKNLFLVASLLLLPYYSNNGLYVWLPEAINRMVVIEKETGVKEGTFCSIMNFDMRNVTVQNNESIINSTFHNNSTILNNAGCREEVDWSVFSNYMILGIVQNINWLAVVAVVKVMNRKYVTIIFTLISIVATTSMLFPNNDQLIIIKASISIIATSAIYPITNGYVVDLFPTNLRAMAGCLSLLMFRTGTIFGFMIAGLLVDHYCYILMYSYISTLIFCIGVASLLPLNTNLTQTKVDPKEGQINV